MLLRLLSVQRGLERHPVIVDDQHTLDTAVALDALERLFHLRRLQSRTASTHIMRVGRPRAGAQPLLGLGTVARKRPSLATSLG